MNIRTKRLSVGVLAGLLLLALSLAFCAVTPVAFIAGAEEPVAGQGYAAQIGDTGYATLADAVAACEDGVETQIQVLQDTKAHVVIANGQRIVLDLAGHTVAFDADNDPETEDSKSWSKKYVYNAVIRNEGELTINDSVGGGGIVSENPNNQGRNAVYSTGTKDGYTAKLTINGGRYTTVKKAAVSVSYTDLLITDGTFTGSTLTSGGSGSLSTVYRSTVTITGGTFNNGLHLQSADVEIAEAEGSTISVRATGTNEIAINYRGDDRALRISGGTYTSVNSYALNVTGAAEMRISGGTFTSTENTAMRFSAIQYQIYENGKLNTYYVGTSIENATFNGKTGALLVNSNANDGTYNVAAPLQVKSGAFTTETGDAVAVDKSAVAQIEGGTFMTLDANGCALNIKSTSTYPHLTDDSNTVSGGTFTGPIKSVTEGFISGGSFGGVVSTDYLADGCVLAATETGYGVIDAADVVAVLVGQDGTETSYTSLQAALDAADSGATVTLKKDRTESVTVAAGKKIVLSLGGCTLTNQANAHTVVNYGDLTVTGDGTVDNISHGRGAVVNYGSANLNGCRFTRSAEAGVSSNDNGGNSWYVIKNYGDLTVDGATVRADGKYSSLIANGYQSASDRTTNYDRVTTESKIPTLTIRSGTFSGGINTLKNDEYGLAAIEGGVFTNVTQAVVMNWNRLTVSGGTFNTEGSRVAAVITGKDTTLTEEGRASGETAITAGTFYGRVGTVGGYGTGVRYAVSGGTYSVVPAAAYFVDGYTAYKNSAGLYVAMEENAAVNELPDYAAAILSKYADLLNETSRARLDALLAEGQTAVVDALAATPAATDEQLASLIQSYTDKMDAVVARQFAEDIAALGEKIDGVNALTATNHAEVKEQIAGLQTDLTALQNAMDAFADTESERYSALTQQLDGLQTKLADLDAMQAAIEALDGKVDGLQELLTALDGTVDTVDGLLDALTATVDTKFAEVAGKLAALETLTDTENAELKEQIDRLHAEIAALTAVTDTLAKDGTDRYAALTAEIAALESKLSALDTLSETIEALGGRVDDMEALINGLNGKMDELSGLNGKIDALTEIVNSLNEKIAASDKKTEGQATAVTAISSVGGLILIGLAAAVIVLFVRKRKAG